MRNGAQVILYEMLGEGHVWPGGPTLPPAYTAALGPRSNALRANALIWSFFSSHQLWGHRTREQCHRDTDSAGPNRLGSI